MNSPTISGATALGASKTSCPLCGGPLRDDGLCSSCALEGALLDPDAETPKPVTSPPKALGPFEVIRVVGLGGMGLVYEARDPKLGRSVAVKVLPERLSGDPEALARFETEMKSVARLSHPNIVTAYQGGEDEGVHFLAMEYLEGRDLHTRVAEDGPVAPAVAVDWILQAARGLASAHEAGIVHRDVKPGNLVVDTGGSLKILDLGLAQFVCESESADTEASVSVSGTFEFMAPEQVTAPEEVDQRADIYSLGCTLFYLLTGHSAFRRSTQSQTARAHLSVPLPKLVDHVPTARSLQPICERMTAKAVDQRYASLDEVIGDLERWQTSAARRWRTAGAVLALSILAISATLGGWWLAQRGAAEESEAASSPPLIGKLAFQGVDADDALGAAVAASGGKLLTGAPRDATLGPESGAAYLLDLGSGEQLAKLFPSDGKAHAHFGSAVAIHGQRALVGANQGSTGTGVAYLFAFDERGAQEIAVLENPDVSPSAGGNFGSALAINERFALAGDTADAEMARGAGAVFLFDVSVSPPRFLAKLTAPDALEFGSFGRSIALDGAWALIGAPGQGGKDTGAAYLFDLNSSPPTHLATLSVPTAESNAHFGHTVALHGNAAVIGAPRERATHPRKSEVMEVVGAAYVFDLTDPHAPQLKHRLRPALPEEKTYFGSSVSLHGDLIAVGAGNPDPRWSRRSFSSQPAVSLFDLASGLQIDHRIPEAGGKTTGFGATLNLGENALVVGAAKSETGTVHCFPRPSIRFRSRLTAPTPINYSGFGSALAVNGSRLVGGASLWHGHGDLRGTGLERGPAPVFLVDLEDDGTPTRIGPRRPSGNYSERFFGRELAWDGARLAVGSVAHFPRTGHTADVHLFEIADGEPHGVGTLAAPDPSVQLTFGKTLAVRGEILAVGTQQGEAPALIYLYRWEEAVAGKPPYAELPLSEFAHSATWLRFHGDLLLAGEHITGNGLVQVYNLKAGPPVHLATLTASDGEAGDRFGASIAITGDRAFIGAPFREEARGKADLGAVYVFDLASSPPRELQRLDPPQDGSCTFGSTLAANDSHLAVRSCIRQGENELWEVTVHDLNALQNPLAFLRSPTSTDRNTAGDRHPLAIVGDQLLIASPNAIINGEKNAGAIYAYDLEVLVGQR